MTELRETTPPPREYVKPTGLTREMLDAMTPEERRALAHDMAQELLARIKYTKPTT